MTRVPIVLLCGCALGFIPARGAELHHALELPRLSLEEAIQRALLNNRQLQIERINPGAAQHSLRAAYGYYDPFFISQVHTESAADTGGFDPANFSADAVFSADSEVATVGLVGFLPTGLTYTLGGSYAHSYGVRNFLNFDSYKTGVGVTVQQPLLRDMWIDQPRWLIQINKRNLEISRLGVRFVASSVINLTQQTYYDLAFAWENLALHQSLLEIRTNFVRNIQRQIELGAMTALEQKLAQSQAASVETDLIAARSAAALASNSLKTLMGLEVGEWTDTPVRPSDFLLLVPQTFNLKQSWEEGMEQRADLAQLAVNLESADITVRFRKNQLFPMVNLIGSYGLKGSDVIQAFPPDNPRASVAQAFGEIEDQNAPNGMVGIIFSFPLTRTAERASYRLSKELQQQARLLLRQKEELVLREIADAIDTARLNFDRALAAKRAVQHASEALQAEEERMRGGTGSILQVLQAQTDWMRAKLAELAARRDYNKAVSLLRFAEGTSLESHDIALEFE